MYDQQLSASMRGGQYGPGKFKARRQGSQSVQSSEDTFQPDAAQGMVQQLPQAPVDYAQWGRNEQKVPQAQDPLQSAILGSARRGAQQVSDGSLSSILAGRQGGMAGHQERGPDTSNAWHSQVMPNGQTGLQMADEYRGLIQGDSMSALQRALGQQGQASGASAQALAPQYDSSNWNTEGWATPQPPVGYGQWSRNEQRVQQPDPLQGAILGSARRGVDPPRQGNDGSLSGFMNKQNQMKDQRVPWKQFAGIGSIEDGYKQLLGREADPDGLAAMQGNPGGLMGALNTMYQSPEAQAYRQSLAPKAVPQGQQGQAQTPQYDSSNWNTEGWGTPQYLGKAAGGPMAGWDQTNWDDPNMQTPKYVVGRILSNYTPTIEGLGQAMTEIQQAYPGAEFDGKDKITIPGLGTIDALVNAGGENSSWGWQDLTNNPGTGGPGGQALQSAILGTPLPGAGAPGAVDPMPTAQGANQYLQQLIQMLQGYGYQVPTGGIPTY